MQKFNFPISDDLKFRLESEAKRSGQKLAEVARRALDEYLHKRESEAEKPKKRIS